MERVDRRAIFPKVDGTVYFWELLLGIKYPKSSTFGKLYLLALVRVLRQIMKKFVSVTLPLPPLPPLPPQPPPPPPPFAR